MSTVSRMKVKPCYCLQCTEILHWEVFTAAGSKVHEAETQHQAMTWAYKFAALQGWTK